MRPIARRATLAVLLLLSIPPAHGEPLDDAWAGVSWGEPAISVLRQLGGRATVLPQPIDFGDSYAPLVVRNIPVGGVPLIAYYQMDKATQALKRIQLERPRHGVTPVAFQRVLEGLVASYGPPDLMCGIRPAPWGGYQAAAERVWTRGGVVIRAIFRDTTLEALNGCLVTGACGLTAQLLLRISPPQLDNAACPAPARPSDIRAPGQPRG
jgi:hypothetical protein